MLAGVFTIQWGIAQHSRVNNPHLRTKSFEMAAVAWASREFPAI
jgi:hypothetical protein